MEQWPTTIPAPMLDFDAEPSCGLADDAALLNPLRLRTYPEQEQKFKVSVTTAQKHALLDFYHTTLNSGAAPFTTDWLPVIGYAHHFARFISVPKFTTQGHLWRAAMTLEVIATVPLAADDTIAYWLPEGV